MISDLEFNVGTLVHISGSHSVVCTILLLDNLVHDMTTITFE